MFKVMYKYMFYLPWVMASLAIIYVSHQETIEYLNGTFYLEDKILHFFAYMIYGITIQIALINSYNYKSKRFYLSVIILGSLFGLSDEIHQYFVKGRSAELLDLLADILGVIFSLSLKNIILWTKVVIKRGLMP
ncbi:MAG: VanZ family protein [Chlorobiota bacterium]